MQNEKIHKTAITCHERVFLCICNTLDKRQNRMALIHRVAALGPSRLNPRKCVNTDMWYTTKYITIFIIHSLNQSYLINSQDEALAMKDELTQGACLLKGSTSFLTVCWIILASS